MSIALRCGAIAFVGLVLAAATPSWAQQPEAASIPVERFFQRPAVLEAKLSPTGRYAAVTTSRGADRIGLAVYEFGTGKSQRVVQFSDTDVIRFDWAGNDRLVYSVADLQAGSGEDRREQPGLFAINADGKDSRQLVRRQGMPFISDGSSRARALDWYHVLLHVPLQQDGVKPNEIVIGRMNLASDNSLESVTPMWLDTVSGRTRSLSTSDEPPGVIQWMFDSVAVNRVKGSMGAYALTPGDTQWRKISEGSYDRLNFVPRAIDDAGALYGSRIEGRGGHAVLARFDFTSMKPEKDALVRVPGFDFRGELILDRAGARALGVRVDADAEQTVWWDPAMKAFQGLVDEKFAGRVNRISCVRCGEADMIAGAQLD